MEVLQRKSRLYELLVLHNYKWYVYCLLKKNMLRSPASTCSYQQISAITCDSLLVALPWGAKMGAKSCSLSQQLVKVNSQCKLQYRFVNTPTVAGSLTSSCSLPGWHLVNSLSLLLFLSPSLFPNPPLLLPPLFPRLSGWHLVGSLSDPGTFFFFFLLTRALPDNTAQPDTNIIKNEELLVRVPANADMKWKVGERRDGCLTVQRERLKNSQWGPVRSAEGPMACASADASQTGVFFYLHPPHTLLLLFVLSCLLSLFLLPAWKTHKVWSLATLSLLRL